MRFHAAPEGEPLSTKFSVRVDGRALLVYVARVASADPQRRFRAMDDKVNSAEFFDESAFVSFDLLAPARLIISAPAKILSARVLPTASGVVPQIAADGSAVSVAVDKPGPLVLEINGDVVGSLQIFANPPERDVPRADAPGVMFFGPGIHEVDELRVPSGNTLYLADGAILRGRPAVERKGGTVVRLEGDHIRLRGRGIIDGSLCPTHSRHLVFVRGRDILLEGVILRDASVWTIPIRESEAVTVSNLKLLGYRANSDGIDICNSREVSVRDCYIRTLDDLIVVKTDKGRGAAGAIDVERCVLWNEVAHALSIGAELREDVTGVRFADCDVIHDRGREWTLRVYHCDSARISDVRFENIRVEESRRLASLWIGGAVWSRDAERGHIADVTFAHVAAASGARKIELKGFDPAHAIERVTFADVTLGGRPVTESEILRNAFVREVRVVP